MFVLNVKYNRLNQDWSSYCYICIRFIVIENVFLAVQFQSRTIVKIGSAPFSSSDSVII